ncbi:hypothetical protein F4678DRAFT_464024 [Xylaria arbuscula]|nr:hypothetical protein F4678DRAFT_464024 [Xylaria arbuscula]
MKLFLLTVAAALANAQADSTGYFPGEPSCALPCLSSAITAAGCQLSDIACQCGPTQSVIAEKVGGCILSSCTNPSELGAAVNAGQAVCSSFFAGELPFTSPTSTPAPGSSSEGTKSSTTGSSSIAVTTPPPTHTSGGNNTTSASTSSGGLGSSTGSGSGFESISSGGATHTTHTTHTDTLLGTSTRVLTGSHTSVPSSTPTGGAAAAASAQFGAGVLAVIMGLVAFL